MALGKGLDALFFDGAEAPKPSKEVKERIITVPLTQVEPNAKQPRQSFAAEGLEELSASIRAHGVLSPILTKLLPSGNYQIIAGERRWRASRMAGLTQVPILVLEVDEQKAMEISLIENLQRENLNAIEEAAGFQSLIDRFSLTQEDAASRVGKSRSAITNSLRLLSLPEKIRILIKEEKLSAGHARALIPLDRDNQIAMAELVVKKGLNVRETEKLASTAGNKKPRTESEENSLGIYLRDFERTLSERLRRKVQIQGGRKGKGKITIEYYDTSDFEDLMAILEGSE